MQTLTQVPIARMPSGRVNWKQTRQNLLDAYYKELIEGKMRTSEYVLATDKRVLDKTLARMRRQLRAENDLCKALAEASRRLDEMKRQNER
jgi:hypothetical protein